MNKKRLFLVVSAVLCLAFVATMFSGFALKTTKAASQEVVYNTISDPKTIDPSLNSAVDGSNIIIACFEGLTRINSKMLPGPGVAKSWDISKDGKTYTFHLRKDAKWSDGKPVTAKDFYYSWMRLITPATAAEYSYQGFIIKGAEDFFNKKAPATAVGIKAVDAYTFQVTLKAPTPYFLELCSWANFVPQREDVVKANPTGWANNPSTYIGNGPFKLVKWSRQDALEFDKNTNYWNAKNVKLNHMTFVMIQAASSYMVSWEKGEVDVIESPPVANVPSLKASGKLTISPYLGSYGIYINTKKAPFNNVKFRKALALAINRNDIINSALKAGQQPAGAWVPSGLKEPNGKDFRDYKKSYYNVDGDVAQAQKLLKESGVNVKGLTIEYLYNTSEAHKMIGEQIQQMWKKNLGINTKLVNQEFAVYLATKTAGNYQVARAGWIGDYSDPMTFLDMWTSHSGQNDIKYRNARYDALIAQAKSETNPQKRMTEMHQAEDMLMADMPLIPIYFYVNTLCINPKVKGLYKTMTGGLYFDNVSIQ